jgi:purine-binding chemotaxis protein CheW
VIQLSSDSMHPAPEFGSILDTRYILGLGTVEERMIIMVDIEQLMTSQEMALVETAVA